MEGGEECDDANRINGDGCDSQCKMEDGWICDFVSPTVCSLANEKLKKPSDGAPTPFDRRTKGMHCTIAVNVQIIRIFCKPQMPRSFEHIRGDFVDGSHVHFVLMGDFCYEFNLCSSMPLALKLLI